MRGAPLSMSRQYWLMKSEPDECSIDDDQARNFMRDLMQVGDGVLFYHSSCPRPGIAGLAAVASGPIPDPTQFDPASRYFDAGSKTDTPRWVLVNVRALCKIDLIGLERLRAHPELAELQVLKRGNRLSITPVTERQWRFITERLTSPGTARFLNPAGGTVPSAAER
jgi:predicted RNA-binding protein with PUA-like domain